MFIFFLLFEIFSIKLFFMRVDLIWIYVLFKFLEMLYLKVFLRIGCKIKFGIFNDLVFGLILMFMVR